MTRPNRWADTPEPLHGMLGERHAMLAGHCDAVLRLLALHANRHAFAKRGVGLAALGKMVHLHQEGLTAGKGFRIEDLQKYVAAPALLGSLRPSPDRPWVSASTMRASPKPLWPYSSPPSSRRLPRGSVCSSIRGSRVGRPSASSSQGCSNAWPAAAFSRAMETVVIDAQMSTRTVVRVPG